MRLNKIKLAGFKSFVDPTTIQFPSNLMGVVGPNGCGKSNIIDAIRWVLGEASAKTLRGDSMADVIFNGSGGRKPVGQASIELHFDNTDGTVSGPYASYAEIAVRRVISRDGLSQYFLNNTRCRRKDITHILLGTGLGSHGYSIIEQGMISRLVEAKPEELRAFLEEAAGISKYKERRRETEHRIRHTRDNLERLADVREEIDKQLGHLQRQARAAERYKQLKADERQTHAELLALRLRTLGNEVDRKENVARERRLAVEAAVAERAHFDAEIDKARVAQAEATEKFNVAQGDYYKVGAEIARLEQAIKHRKETIQRQQDDLEETQAQLAEILEHITSDEVELEAIDKVLAALNPDHDAAVARLSEVEETLRAAELAMEEWRSRRDEIAQSDAELERTVQVERTRLEQMAAQRDRIVSEIEAHKNEAASVEAKTLEERIHAFVANEEKVAAACEDAGRALSSLTGQIAQLRDQEKRVVARLDEVRDKLQTDRGRLTSLDALQEAALGRVSAQIERWLKSQSLDDAMRLAETLEVERGWERAVEMALGNYLQAVTVRNVDDVAASLADAGEASVSLIERPDPEVQPQAPEQNNGLKSLASYVHAPANAVALLHGVYATESLATALELRAGLSEGESIVTQGGVWIGKSWLRISGRDDPRLGVIARGDEIERLRSSVASESRRAEEIAKALHDTRTRLEQLEGIREKTQTEANRRQHLKAEIAARLTSARQELSQRQARAAKLTSQIEELEREQESLVAATRSSETLLEQAAQKQEELRTAKQELAADEGALRERVAGARDRAERYRAEAQEIAIKVESRRTSKESASAALERIRAQQVHLERRKSELEAQLTGARAPLANDEQALESHLAKHGETETALAEARRSVEAVESRLRETGQVRAEKQQAVEQTREAADAVRLELREVQVRVEAIREQFDATGLDLETITTGLPEEAEIGAWSERLERLDRSIQRLGPINLAAIDEFEEQSERKAYLDAQHKDLSDALETLENAIRKIDRETRAKFKDTFDRANQGLGELFPRLFGGGHAYLELGDDDLLTAGVSIMAKPPGKRISTIHLLSGGEKALTAVALVFSIFELNPAPFCLLDEVDAPLDEANVGRFCEIVREMAKRVQFVIITHNKTTMESMDQLSGVTMNEPGVSRLVAVDIDEAVQLAAM
jgi:chromosome segregation protein